MVALQPLVIWLERRKYQLSGASLRDRLIGSIPEIMREIEHSGPLGIGLATAARLFAPFITTMNAKKTGRTPPDYQALRRAKQDVLLACCYYWFDQTWDDVCQTQWSLDTTEAADGSTWIFGLAPFAPAVVEDTPGRGDRPTANGDSASIPTTFAVDKLADRSEAGTALVNIRHDGHWEDLLQQDADRKPA